jgi:hypothetical protein
MKYGMHFDLGGNSNLKMSLNIRSTIGYKIPLLDMNFGVKPLHTVKLSTFNNIFLAYLILHLLQPSLTPLN